LVGTSGRAIIGARADPGRARERAIEMTARMGRRMVLSVLATMACLSVAAEKAAAATAAEIDAKADLALKQLYAEVPVAERLAEDAVGVLVFPSIIKGGLFVGGQYGEGVLLKKGTPAGYYNIASLSYGLQIGAQGFSQVLMFMTDAALGYLAESKGFEIGADATVALADKGVGGDLSTTTLQSPIVAFVFGQEGLMGGISIEGTKITEIDK